MSLSRTICLCLVVAVAAVHVNGFVDKIKETANKAASTMTDAAVDEAMKYFCDHAGQFMDDSMNKNKCEPEDEKHCKFINNAPMMYRMMCDMGGDNAKDAFKNYIKCKTVNCDNPQKCLEDWYEQYKTLAATVETAANASG